MKGEKVAQIKIDVFEDEHGLNIGLHIETGYRDVSEMEMVAFLESAALQAKEDMPDITSLH